jgi:hypothetical protein
MIRSGLIAALLAASAATVAAHHGFGTFDLSRSVTFTGKLTKLEFINPHSWLYFEVTDASGKVTKHRCEMRSAHTLRRSGWKESLFPIGQTVTVDASPDRADPASCYLNTIKFPDGSSMDRYGQYVKTGGKITEVRGAINTPNTTKREARRRSGEPNISGDWAPEQVVMRDPRGTGGGLVPLSQIGERPAPAPPRQGGAPAAGGDAAARQGGTPAAGADAAARQGGARAAGDGRGAAGGGRGGGRGGLELTEAGKAAASKLTRDNNPRFKCETTSILFDWTFDGPVNRITQNNDNIVIQYGQMNLKRTVFMRMKEHPTNIKPTRAGHSIGRWEGDTLVVDTVGFLPGVLTGNTPHSAGLHTVERFTLDPKTFRLTREYTAEDAAFFKGQYTGRDVVMIADAPYTEDDCKDLQFVDYSKQQATKK